MPAQPTISPWQPVDGQSPKEAEIKLLLNFVALCKEGSYLSGLFTPDFIDYVTSHMNSDIVPDLYADYRHFTQEAANFADESRRNQKMAEEIGANYAEAQRIWIQERHDVEAAHAKKDEYLENRVEELHKLNAKAYADLAKAYDREEAAKNTILVLKAKLYDLLQRINDLEVEVSDLRHDND